MTRTVFRLVLLSVFAVTPALAEEAPLPSIAIIIDDLGDQRAAGENSIALPGPVAVSILPHTPYARRLARSAHANHKEVLLHLPLEADSRLQPGPGVMQLEMNKALFRITLEMNLDALPFLSGVNNHMGSKLTRYRQQMHWLMDQLEDRDLFFVDSVTTPASVAYRVAAEHGVPATRRHVFLDDLREGEEIRRQFDRLLKLARRNGYAVAIGHPYPETLQMLNEEIPDLARHGVKLVPVATIVDLEMMRRSAAKVVASY